MTGSSCNCERVWRRAQCTCRFMGDTMVTREYMRSGAASNRSGKASFMAPSSADVAVAGTPYHTCTHQDINELPEHMQQGGLQLLILSA